MPSRLRAAVAALAAVGWLAVPGRAQAAAVSDAALALRWAPIHRQDVDPTGGHAIGGRADWITRIDFDGNWAGRDNWEHARDHPLRATVYYSVVTTRTHWYLTYLFYHPRDWAGQPFFEREHENDAEGMLFAVERDGSAHGVLRGAVAVAHSDFFAYVPAGSTWTAGRETVDGVLRFADAPYDGRRHPVTAQEAHGHGLYAPAGDTGGGLVYQPATVAGVPGRGRDARYRLADIFAPGGLWARRADPELFAGWGRFAGDAPGSGADRCGGGTWGCRVDAANAPWGWDDHDDPPARGTIATDPAGLVATYFTVPGPFARTYTVNPYAGREGPPTSRRVP
ncbi:hypothetical protein Drose_18630 [Dactylosporangium roseum]|uniref:Uncharacterized protein n=1 Tax=Dactylosporangium roseum TaxID=47989 RepID=A0ABY5ZGF6_9ACTN|nr:hypothetical protein [Dactylosporangium roseum]UWZ40033.1 hypothetical protein Drose_18630 [Dactylosporangium roseum]